jgi:PAS domain S-box-containing protein
MKIKTRLQINTTLSIAIVLVIGLILFLAAQRVNEASERNKMANTIVKGMSEIETLTYEYVMYHEERAQMQWQLKHTSLGKLLTSVDFGNSKEQHFLNKLRQHRKYIKNVFDQMTQNYKNLKIISQDRVSQFQSIEERLIGQLMVQSQAMISDAFQLSNLSRAAMKNSQRSAYLFITVFVGTLTVVIALISYLLSRSIMAPIEKLHRGAQVIGTGDLDFQIDIVTEDEIGLLSTTFNQMTEQLKTITVSRDELTKEITERKQAVKALQMSEEKLHLIIETSPVGICTVDTLGDFVMTNLAYERMVGYSKEELRGLSFFDVTHPDDRPRNKKLFQDMFSLKMTGFFMEKKYIRKDGTEIEVAVHAAGIGDAEGNARFGTAFVIDITKRKEAEEELEKHRKHLELMVEERTTDLKKAQEALLKKERLAAIGQLSGSVAHDIRNPLGSIKNSIYFLNLISNDSTDDQIKKHLNIMEKEILRANDIITDLLNFSRENKPIMVEGQINNVILDSLKGFNIPEKITVETELDSALPMLPFDALQIERVFYNLVTNALQAMAAGGLLKISSCKSDGNIEVQIQDSGTGISPEALESIFNPLFTTKSKGVGLGLSIVKTFVEKHNGTVEVYSEAGKGTTFTVRLPIIQEETT